MKRSPSAIGATGTAMAPDALEQLLHAEASLADEYERAQEEATRLLRDARQRAEAIEREGAARAAAERQRVAERLDAERGVALAGLAAETARGVARWQLADDRVRALAEGVVTALMAQLAAEARA